MSQDSNIDQIKKLLESASYSLDKAKNLLSKVDPSFNKPDYSNFPGVEGTFDGVYLVSADGTKHEVPANYAAKSRLIFGDTLKMIDDEGKTLFKQISKADRKKVDGVMSKKEGKWYVITDSGSFRISDVAAEFNKLEINDKVVVLIPAQKTPAQFAALDKVMNKPLPVIKEVPAVEKPKIERVDTPKKAEKVETAEKIEKPVRAEKAEITAVQSKPIAIKPVIVKKPAKKPVVAPKAREFVQNIASVVPTLVSPAKPSKIESSNPIATASPTSATSSILEDDDLR